MHHSSNSSAGWRVRKLATLLSVWLAGACSQAEAARPKSAQAEADAQWMLEYYVAALQERHQLEAGRFTDHYDTLTDVAGRQTSEALRRPKADIVVRISGADSLGWSASASHPAFPGAACVLTVGRPAQRAAVAGPPIQVGSRGQVVCSGFDG